MRRVRCWSRSTIRTKKLLLRCARARRLVEDAERDAHHAYAGIDTAGLAPDAIFPFHPAALKALRTIASRPVADPSDAGRPAIVPLSRLAREVLASSTFDGADGELPARPIYPPDLTMNAEIAKLLKVLMPEADEPPGRLRATRSPVSTRTKRISPAKSSIR